MTLYKPEDFLFLRTWRTDSRPVAEHANALHDERCPYKARGVEDENGNEYAQVMAMKDAVAQRDAEIERLRAENVDLKQTVEQQHDLHADFEADNARLREALEFYADEKNWSAPTQVNRQELFDCAMGLDLGAKARAALEGK